MDKKKPSKDGRGNVRYLWVLVGAYLLYLAYQQAQLLWRGEATKTMAAVCVVSGLVFAGVGAWVIFREWQAWRYAQAHKDDPETWGDPSETETADDSEAAELPEASAENPDAVELSEASEETDEDEAEGVETRKEDAP